MSTHATPEIRDAPTAEPTTDATADTGGDSDFDATPDADATDDPAPIDSFDAHDAAATFGASTARLPNTVDAENEYLG